MTSTSDRRRTSQPVFLISALILLLTATDRLAAQFVPGLEIVRSDREGMEIVLRPEIAWDRTQEGDLLPNVAGSLIGGGDPGAPITPEIILPVGLPSDGGLSLQVLSTSYYDDRSGRIAPTPTMVVDSDGITTELYVRNPVIYGTWRGSDPVVEFLPGGRAAGLDVGRIAIRPIRFNASASTISSLREVRIRITYRGSTDRPGAPSAVAMSGLRTGLLNGAIADSWVSAPSQPALARRARVTNARAWFRVDVAQDGLYAIKSDDFSRAGISPSSIREVAVYGGAGTPLPTDVDAALDNRMQQVPTIVERSGGTISRVLFVGHGTTGWTYEDINPSDSIPRRVNNPYSTTNSYIVAVDGDPIREFDARPDPGGTTTTATHGIARLLVEEDLTNAIAQGNSGNGGGQDWFGTSLVVDDFRPEEKRIFPVELVGLDRTQPVDFRVRVAHNARNGGSGLFTFEQNGMAVGNQLSLISVSGEQSTARAAETTFRVDGGTIPSDNRALLGVTYRYPTGGTGFFDFFEVHYARTLTARSDRIVFEAPNGSGVAEYRVNGFSTNQLVGFDITDPENPTRITPISSNGGSYVFSGPLSTVRTESRRYLITALTAARSVSDLEPVNYAGLRQNDPNAQLLVVTHPDFRAEAEDFAAYRRSTGMTTAVVATDEIYTEFSAGRLDPTAIRDFVAHVYHTSATRPGYLLLVGDGHFDYRKISTDVDNYVPVYTDGERSFYDDIAVSVYDDYFVRVDGDDFYIDLAPGRFPVTTAEEAATVVAKIKQYESPSSFGPWRERVLLVADDNAPVNEARGFLPQSERLDTVHTPHWIETEKIYLQEYPDVQGVRVMKPGATQDIVQWINRGVLLVNWVGHGNARVWGHEHVLDRDEFMPQLKNDTTLTMVMAVTCNFGRFDNPKEVSGGELFLTHEGGGASVVLATTRAVYVTDNALLMYAYFSSLFLRDPVTNDHLRLGDALLATKIRQGARRDNDQKYLIFGDPTMYLAIPEDSVAIEQVNMVDVSVDTARIRALGEVEVIGSIRDRRGGLQSDFNGTAIVSLYDADRIKEVPRKDSELPYTMKEKGGQLFRGPATVVDGRFTARFRIPKDIAFDSTRTGRMYVYAVRSARDRDAVGSTCNVMIFGSDTTSVSDGAGPDITIYMDDRTFMSGDVVTPTPMLLVDLADPSGINASGAGLGHRIEAWIGDSPTPIDLTEFYTTSAEDYRVGSAERELLGLEPGEYRVRVRAWDIFNNPAEAVAWFRIVEGEATDLVVTEVFNYPNPMTRSTDFLFRHNQTAPLDVEVDIYSPSGRKIRSLDLDNATDRHVRVPWDGTDADGRRVGNGIYLWRLRVSVGEGSERRSFEVVERLAVLR